MTAHYTYRVTWSPDDQEHVGLCAEFPSLSWLAASPEDALAGIRTLVREILGEMEQEDVNPSGAQGALEGSACLQTSRISQRMQSSCPGTGGRRVGKRPSGAAGAT